MVCIGVVSVRRIQRSNTRNALHNVDEILRWVVAETQHSGALGVGIEDGCDVPCEPRVVFAERSLQCGIARNAEIFG